jgi:ribosomal protein S18 acetylase RimI-like enzyme
MNLRLKKCDINDLKELHKISHETFYNSFKELCTAEVMKNYLDDAFNEQKILEEIKNQDSIFYFLYYDDVLAGYFKINEYDAQTDFKNDDSLELERIYVIKEFQGLGLGNHLMEKVKNIASEKGKKNLWLGVWEKNKNAIKFYEKSGFIKTGEHDFFMGDEKQNDYVFSMRLRQQ